MVRIIIFLRILSTLIKSNNVLTECPKFVVYVFLYPGTNHSDDPALREPVEKGAVQL